MKLIDTKEFASLKYKAGPELPIDGLSLQTHQLFTERWMNPDHNHKNILIKHMTGSGKTLMSLALAMNFIKLFRTGFIKGNVIILGFQKNTFITEIFRRPELGFFSSYEYQKLYDLSQNRGTVDGEQLYNNWLNKLKKKLEITFYGYQELYNALFPEGEDKPNKQILELFENSLIIADEIHNTYNSVETNSYGRAIRYIKNNTKLLYSVFMSATPLSNKPTEIIDLMNLLITGAEYKTEDFFTENGKLLPTALKQIKHIFSGYVSYYNNNDLSQIPKLQFEGKTKIGFIRVIECDYTPAQQKEIKRLGKIGLDSQGLYDGVINTGEYLVYKKDEFGLIESIQDYKIAEISKKYDKFLNDLMNVIKNKTGKIIIYHEAVYTFGVKFILNMLKFAGLIEKDEPINSNSLCNCGVIYKNHNEDHEFTPVRMLMLIGEMDKKLSKQHLDLFNSQQNLNGEKYRILIGSSAIVEGLDFTAVQELFILHILPHISALKQLIGRTVRIKSHIDLPPEQQNVKVFIYAVPAEVKLYRERMEKYQMIEEIEKVIEKSAIEYIGERPGFGKKYTVDTYDVFYGSWEVREIQKIIRALFIQTPVWKYNDLINTVRDPPFKQYIDYSKISEDNFILALGELIYSPLNIIKNGAKYKIAFVDEYYILFPVMEKIDTVYGKNYDYIAGEPIITNTSWMILPEVNNIQKIEITENLLSINKNYEEMKHNFYLTFKNVDMLTIPLSTEIYNRDFHIKLIEDCIVYIFNILIQNTIKSEYHEFYFKLLHYYSKVDLIIYGNQLPEKYKAQYKKYITKETDTNNFLISSIKNTSSISSFDISEIDKFLNKKVFKPVPSNIMPVGYILNTSNIGAAIPKFYLPSGWFESPDFNKVESDEVENDIIIGYYQSSESSIEFKFKLRKPRHKIVISSDKRKIEKGVFCESKNKKELMRILKELNISKIIDTNKDMCLRIKEELLHRELKDRNKFRKGQVPNRTRWCYLQFENGEI